MDKKDILIVDDDPGLRKTLSDILKAKGYTPITAANGKEALDKAREEGPALALIDLELEDMSGLEVIKWIKEYSPGTECIVITGHALQESAIEAVNLGVYSYMRKPYDMEQLLHTVRRAIEKQEAGESLGESLGELLAASNESRLALLSVLEDQKQAEEGLRISEENFRRSLDESPLGVRVVSTEGETLYINRSTQDIFGYDSIEEWQTTPIVKRYTEQSYAESKVRREKRRFDTDDSSEYEIDIVRKDGEVRHLYVWRTRIIWNGKAHDQLRYSDTTEGKRAEKKLRETLDSLRKAVSTTIHVLVSAVEARDPYTSGHQTRSADLARAIATEMGLSEEKVEGIRMAGSIHDIGKLSIPAEILSKPTKLSEIEFSLIKEHPRKGFEMLKDVESPWPLAEIVYQHHERLDGSGYPKKLKGEEICIEARILAVADVVEAMASHRPYRPSLGIDAALNEIEKNRGLCYDNTVADACLKLFREKGFSI